MKISAEQPLQVVEKSGKRVAGIDILRGLCIIAVVLHHINIRIHFRDSSFGHWIGPAANRVLFWNGYYGVRVFFVISGFLITGWSLQRWGSLRQLNIRQFYRMRFARIVPCLLGLLLILAVLDRAGASQFTINTQHTSLGRALIAALSFNVKLAGSPHRLSARVVGCALVALCGRNFLCLFSLSLPIAAEAGVDHWISLLFPGDRPLRADPHSE